MERSRPLAAGALARSEERPQLRRLPHLLPLRGAGRGFACGARAAAVRAPKGNGPEARDPRGPGQDAGGRALQPQRERPRSPLLLLRRLLPALRPRATDVANPEVADKAVACDVGGCRTPTSARGRGRGRGGAGVRGVRGIRIFGLRGRRYPSLGDPRLRGPGRGIFGQGRTPPGMEVAHLSPVALAAASGAAIELLPGAPGAEVARLGTAMPRAIPHLLGGVEGARHTAILLHMLDAPRAPPLAAALVAGAPGRPAAPPAGLRQRDTGRAGPPAAPRGLLQPPQAGPARMPGLPPDEPPPHGLPRPAGGAAGEPLLPGLQHAVERRAAVVGLAGVAARGDLPHRALAEPARPLAVLLDDAPPVPPALAGTGAEAPGAPGAEAAILGGRAAPHATFSQLPARPQRGPAAGAGLHHDAPVAPPLSAAAGGAAGAPVGPVGPLAVHAGRVLAGLGPAGRHLALGPRLAEPALALGRPPYRPRSSRLAAPAARRAGAPGAPVVPGAVDVRRRRRAGRASPIAVGVPEERRALGLRAGRGGLARVGLVQGLDIRLVRPSRGPDVALAQSQAWGACVKPSLRSCMHPYLRLHQNLRLHLRLHPTPAPTPTPAPAPTPAALNLQCNI